MKSAAGAWRIKQMCYSAADNRADNAKHHCPCDRQMCVQQRFRDTARNETDKNVPDKMKHDVSPLISAIRRLAISDPLVTNHSKFGRVCPFSLEMIRVDGAAARVRIASPHFSRFGKDARGSTSED